MVDESEVADGRLKVVVPTPHDIDQTEIDTRRQSERDTARVAILSLGSIAYRC